MKITQGQLEEFKKIYKKQTGDDLPDDEAIQMAKSLLNIIQLVYKPIETKGHDKRAKKLSIPRANH